MSSVPVEQLLIHQRLFHSTRIHRRPAAAIAAQVLLGDSLDRSAGVVLHCPLVRAVNLDAACAAGSQRALDAATDVLCQDRFFDRWQRPRVDSFGLFVAGVIVAENIGGGRGGWFA